MRKLILGLIIMIAMVGTASAAHVSGIVYDENNNPLNGATVTAYSDASHTNVLGSTTSATDSFEGDGYYYIDFDGTSVVDNTIYLTATKDGAYGESEAEAPPCENGCSVLIFCSDIRIPEFPTIALPIAAIIGLVFIFQRRREEE